MKNQRNLQNSMKKKTSLLLKVVIVFDGDDWIRDFLLVFELFKFLNHLRSPFSCISLKL
jgi:hypothetical protein